MLAVGKNLHADGFGFLLLQNFGQNIQVGVTGENGVVLIAHINDMHALRSQYVGPRLRIGGHETPLREQRGNYQLDAAQNVVGRAYVWEAKYFVYSLLQIFEVACTSVSFVAEELTRQLLLSHRAGA